MIEKILERNFSSTISFLKFKIISQISEFKGIMRFQTIYWKTIFSMKFFVFHSNVCTFLCLDFSKSTLHTKYFKNYQQRRTKVAFRNISPYSLLVTTRWDVKFVQVRGMITSLDENPYSLEILFWVGATYLSNLFIHNKT